MKKRAIAILLCVVCAGVLLAGCAGTHKITVTGDKSLIYKCPSRGKVGETITVETVMVTDAELYLDVRGADVRRIEEGVFEFTMPDRNVEVSAYVSTEGFPGA